MSTESLRTDYLIIGSGAVGMAFADVLLADTAADIVMVDRHHGPGGHWNDAYPFVRLHQPSAYYGVNSRKLGGDAQDTVGWNIGMCERATGAELLAYYESTMQQFLASGRMRYFPMSEAVGSVEQGFHIRSLVSGEQRAVVFDKKVVDTTYLNTAVPSTHPPKYVVAPGLRCIPLNGLARVTAPPSGFVVIGAGKTGIDACLWLLENRVAPDAICWIMPRDSWFLNRANVQPGMEFFVQSLGAMATQMECIAQSQTVPDLFGKLEASGQLLRLDTSIEPTMYHAAVMSQAELQALRQIRNIVRMGRVLRIEPDQMVLQHGTVATDAQRLYVDCSASAAELRPAVPIFQGQKIVPQFVRAFQPTFSAALVAHLEATIEDEAIKNQLCGVVPPPDTPLSWLTMQAASMANSNQWSKVKGLGKWISESRLDGFSKLMRSVDPADTEKLAVLQRFGAHAAPAAQRLRELLAQARG